MKRILMIACAAGALALAGCGSLPSDPSGWVIALDQGYHTYCGQAGHSAGCAAADQQKEHDLVQAALTGIADWQSGKITAEEMQQTLAALENLIRDFESGGKHHKDASQGAGLLGVLAWPLSALLGLFWSS